MLYSKEFGYCNFYKKQKRERYCRQFTKNKTKQKQKPSLKLIKNRMIVPSALSLQTIGARDQIQVQVQGQVDKGPRPQNCALRLT